MGFGFESQIFHMEITCIKCKLRKNVNEFSINDSKKTGHNNWCKSCTQQYINSRAEENQKYVWELLENSCCAICKISNPLVLEFDHLDPKIKSFDIKRLTRKSKNKIIEEIAKCQILCRNCHMRKTHYQFNTWRIKYLKSNDINTCTYTIENNVIPHNSCSIKNT